MKSITQEYRDIVTKQAYREEKKQFDEALDAQIVKSLAAAGYSPKQIQEALSRLSPVLYQGQSHLNRFVQQQLSAAKLTPCKQPNLSADRAYQQARHSRADDIMQFSLKYDRQVACQLLDKGWKIKEIQNGVLEKSVFAGEVKEEKLRRIYCDKVLAGINHERLQRLGSRFALAQDLYLQKTASLRHKYDGYNNEKYNDFQEGSVVLSMMLQAEIPSGVIAEVLRKNSRNDSLKKEAGYVERIMNQCETVRQAYQAIARMTPKQVRTPADTYRLCAKEYMQQMHIEMLNGKDEQKIVQHLVSQKFSEQDLAQALTEASPVAMEPGRNRDNYIASMMSVAAQAKDKLRAQESYILTAALYEEKIEQKQHLLSQKKAGIEQNRVFFDGIVVRELIEMKQYVPHIIQTIMDKSPQAALQPDKTPKSYAQWLVDAAQKVIAAEKAILGYAGKLLPSQDNGQYSSLLQLGYTAKDLFQAAIKERVQVYPSVALSLNASFVDKDACEKLLTKYPDFSLDDLKQAVQEMSPRAQMPGVSPQYAELVIQEVEQRIEKSREQENQVKEIQREYLRQCGLANEGVEPEANMLAYHDGRAALQMLLQGIDPMEIRNSIAAGADQPHGDPGEYADTIMQQVENVKERLDNIKTYPLSQEPQNAAEEYRQRLAQAFQQRQYVSSSMDAAIAADMMLLGQYKAADIIAAIQDHSPAAIEPGRGARYSNFIEERARETIEQEQQKLKYYVPIPRLQIEGLAQKEYAHHVSELQHCIRLPLTQDMDLMIAKAMIEQGFRDKELITTFDQSPCSRNKRQYGTQIVRTAHKSLSKEKEQEMGFGREIKPLSGASTE